MELLAVNPMLQESHSGTSSTAPAALGLPTSADFARELDRQLAAGAPTVAPREKAAGKSETEVPAKAGAPSAGASWASPATPPRAGSKAMKAAPLLNEEGSGVVEDASTTPGPSLSKNGTTPPFSSPTASQGLIKSAFTKGAARGESAPNPAPPVSLSAGSQAAQPARYAAGKKTPFAPLKQTTSEKGALHSVSSGNSAAPAAVASNWEPSALPSSLTTGYVEPAPSGHSPSTSQPAEPANPEAPRGSEPVEAAEPGGIPVPQSQPSCPPAPKSATDKAGDKKTAAVGAALGAAQSGQEGAPPRGILRNFIRWGERDGHGNLSDLACHGGARFAARAPTAAQRFPLHQAAAY